MNKNTEFKWNDKLAMELCEYVGMRVGKDRDIRQQVELLTEDFKESKVKKEGQSEKHGMYVPKKRSNWVIDVEQLWEMFQKGIEQSKSKKEEPQWDILAFELKSGVIATRDKDGYYRTLGYSHAGGTLLWNKERIYSVKRLSDGEVFSVGDVVYYKDGSEKSEPIRWCIDNFYIREDKVMLARSKDCTLVETIDNNCYLKKQAPKEEQVPIKVHDFHKHSNSDKETWYSFLVGGHIPESKYQSIKSAIEDVLNNKYKPWKMYQTGFTSEELLQARRDAFKEARLAWASSIKQPFDGVYKHETVEDYINSLK